MVAHLPYLPNAMHTFWHNKHAISALLKLFCVPAMPVYGLSGNCLNTTHNTTHKKLDMPFAMLYLCKCKTTNGFLTTKCYKNATTYLYI